MDCDDNCELLDIVSSISSKVFEVDHMSSWVSVCGCFRVCVCVCVRVCGCCFLYVQNRVGLCVSDVVVSLCRSVFLLQSTVPFVFVCVDVVWVHRLSIFWICPGACMMYMCMCVFLCVLCVCACVCLLCVSMCMCARVSVCLRVVVRHQHSKKYRRMKQAFQFFDRDSTKLISFEEFSAGVCVCVCACACCVCL